MFTIIMVGAAAYTTLFFGALHVSKKKQKEKEAEEQAGEN